MTIPQSNPIARVVVVASNLQRLGKLFSLLQSNDDNDTTSNSQHELQYLPCVAQFDRYRQENEWITYLVNVEYHPELIDTATASSSSLPTSLLELANSQNDADDETVSFATISDLVIGNGIDTDNCTKDIQSYFQTLFSLPHIPLHRMEPTPPYTTMAEELFAYQALSLEEKEMVQGTMGPGKMVHLIRSVGQKRIQEYRDRLIERQRQLEAEEKQRLQEEQEEGERIQQEEEEHIIDPNKLRYACRICRNILFGQDDLIEHQAKATTSDATKTCQSYFLHQSLPWMKPQASSSTTNTNTTNLDNDLRETLGRLVCQKCHAKLGTWNWSGTPCSCGAWVVPAFQFPKSKVDAVHPATGRSSTATESS